MTQLNIENAKYAEWATSHQWDSCQLQLSELGKFIANYISEETTGFVLSINGSWGAGKTEFLKRLYVEFINRNQPVIYIDAWESDFSDSPIRVVTSEIINQIKNFDVDETKGASFDRLKHALGGLLKGSAIALSSVVSKQLTGDGDAGKVIMENILSMEPVEFTEHISQTHENQVQSIKEIRASLADFSLSLQRTHGARLPVIVLVDELDRCRPDYSISMLESIKHFFNTDNFVFVVSNNTDQLCASIKAIYGDNFDSRNYLNRFFNRVISLPTPDILTYVINKNLSFAEMENFAFYGGHRSIAFYPIFSALCVAHNLLLRDVDQVYYKICACLRHLNELGKINGTNYLVNFVALVYGILQHHTNNQSLLYDYSTIHHHQFNVPDVSFEYGSIKTWVELSLFSITVISEQNNRGGYNHVNHVIWPHEELSKWRTIINASGSSQLTTYLDMMFTLVNGHSNVVTKKPGGNEFEFKSRDNYQLLFWDSYVKLIKLSGTIS